MGVGEFGEVDGSKPSQYRQGKFGPGDPWNQFGAELDRRRWLKQAREKDGDQYIPMEQVAQAEMLEKQRFGGNAS